jgi:hypothetical protein
MIAASMQYERAGPRNAAPGGIAPARWLAGAVRYS